MYQQPQRYHLLRFGGGERAYLFPNTETGQTHFGAVATRTVQMPGMDGGHDPYGSDTAPDDVVEMPVTVNLAADTYPEMAALVDDLMKIKFFGKRPLWMQPLDLDMPRRWCSARVGGIRIMENAKLSTETLQPAQINFQVNHPRWYNRPNQYYLTGGHMLGEVPLVDGPTTYLDDGEVLGSVNLSPIRCRAMVSGGDEIHLLNMGNATAPATVTLAPSRPWQLDEGLHFGDRGVMIGAYGSSSVYAPAVKRLDDWGAAAQGFRWNGTLSVNEKIEVSAKDYSVTRYFYPNFNASGFPDFERLAGSGFIMMQPGLNVLRIEGTFDGPFGWLTVDFDDAWY